MGGERSYLDHNATTALRPAARVRMIECLDGAGNASSIHAEGRRARAAIEIARRQVAGLLETAADLVTFTSGATEAAALALTPSLRDGAGGLGLARLLLGPTEHPAVVNGHRFPSDRVEVIPAETDGTIDLKALQIALRADGPVVLALQAANGETGVLQPVAAASALVRREGGLVICDAAQAAGRIDCRFNTLDADVILISGHKLGGPQGIGALAMRSGRWRIGTPLVAGGGQERGLRGGTENTPAIAGFGAAAAEAARLVDAPRWAELRDEAERRLRTLAPDLVVFGAAAPRLPNTLAFAIPGVRNDTLMIGLDLAGIAVSTGSACSSGKVSSSHVLETMGVDAHLRSGLIRVSLGWSSRADDIDGLVDALASVLRRIGTRPKAAA